MMLIAVLFILLIAATNAHAQEYLIQHWLVGRTLNSADGVADGAAAGKTLHIHYGGDETPVAVATVQAGGRYQIDLGEMDPNWYTVASPRTVNVLVHHPPSSPPPAAPNNYGSGPVPLIPNRAAVQEVGDMQVALGGGWPDPTIVVVARIQRVAGTNDIRVSWIGPATTLGVDIFRGEPPMMYAATQHDTQYYFDPHQSTVPGATWNWVSVVATAVPPGGGFVEANQIGAGWPQAYYKVLDNAFGIADAVVGGVPLTPDQDAAFRDTEAVGKYDFLLENGYSLISLPLLPFDTTMAEVFGSQLNGLNPNIFGYSAAQGLRRGYLTATNEWAGPITNDGVHPDRGYWLSVNLPSGAAPRRVTIIGEVASGPRSIPLGANQSALIGFSLPFNSQLTNATHANLVGALSENDSIYGFLHDRATNQGSLFRAFRAGGGFGGPLSGRGIGIGKGYWVIRGSGSNPTLTINRDGRDPL